MADEDYEPLLEEPEESDEPDRPKKKRNTMSKKDERMMAMFCHLGGILGGFILPLVIWLVKREESRYIDYHGKEALNFQITMLIAHFVAGFFACFTFGLTTLVVLALSITFCVIASTAANNGEYYRYPMTIRFIQ
jgi:uncharacterized Tic20 family protein